MAPYLYKPLDASLHEIRLLHLSPGRYEDDIEFRMVHVPLPPPTASAYETKKPEFESLGSLVSWPWTVEEIEGGDVVVFNVVSGETRLLMAGTSPTSLERTSERQARYEALSYTWGDDKITDVGHVRDREDSGKPCMTLGLRPNLAFALRNLRHSDETRVLWIDAICINQDDIKERNEQVKRMTNIYTLAERVVIWIGEESNSSKLALSTLEHIGKQLDVTKSGRIIAAHDAVEPQCWRNDHSLPFDQPTWKALISFVERAWFYRVWCWQEVKLGSSHAYLQCGSNGIPWRKFWMAILCINNKDNLPSTRFRERCRHIVFLDYDSAGHSLSNILDISRSKGCADPKDKIYGLLGMTAKYFSSSIVVEYLQPLRNVYRDAFLAHLSHTKRLELLKHCDLENHKIGGPSWVPDWSMTEFAAPVLSEQLSSGISRAWFTHREPDILEVVGKQYTTIKTISGIASKVEENTLLAVSEWFQCLPDKGSYITGETMDAAFALTLCMNRTKERHPYSHFMSTSQWLGMLRRILCLSDTSQNDAIYSERETANTIQKLRGRRFVTTESGHIGTAPAGARAGK
jgi:hypothetical protein